MNSLMRIAAADSQWPLDAFVAVANELLPEFLPEEESGCRDRDSITPRLVRYYTTQGLLDKPLKQGREARYRYRHLLQLLLLRRLLAQGYRISSIEALMRAKGNGELESLLQGGIQLTVEAANPALAFLAQVRDRIPGAPSPAGSRSLLDPSPLPAAAPPPPAAPHPPLSAAEAPPPTPPASRWYRQEILDGLELHLRDDFAYPASPHERDLLLQLIAHHLTHLSQLRRSPHD